MFKYAFPFVFAVSAALSALQTVSAEDSPQFRGPSGNGVFPSSLPNAWDDQTGVRWSVDIPGGGWSSPVTANDRIYLTTAVSESDAGPKGFGEGVQSMGDFYRSKAPDQPYSFELHCLNEADGSPLWKKTIVSRIPPHKIHPSNSYATESPVTDGKFIYTYFAAIGVVTCFDVNGQQIWTRELGAYKTGNDFGTGSSLALHNAMVFIQCDNEEKSFLVALSTKTGEDVWRHDREGGTSWSSPIIWKNRERTELIACGRGIVTSYEPATGKILWKLTEQGGAYSASPAFDERRLYLGQSGRTSRGPLLAVNAGASGEMTVDNIGDKQLAWVIENAGPGMCSPVAIDNCVYVLSRGILSCHNAETGEQLYKERLKNSSRVTSSLWAAGDSLFALNESGETSVVKTGSTFRLAGTNALEGLFWSTPSSTDSALLIRGAKKLYCIASE